MQENFTGMFPFLLSKPSDLVVSKCALLLWAARHLNLHWLIENPM